MEKDFIDDLHEGLETIQTVLTVLMLGLVLVGTITTAMGNMLGTWYAVYYYQVCEVINDALTALDLALYMYDIIIQKIMITP